MRTISVQRIPHNLRSVGKMASISKIKSGYRAQVARKGIRKSRVFPTRKEARDWAARVEYEITNAPQITDRAPFATLLDRYAREVSPTRRGYRWEALRLEKLQKDELARVAIADLSARDFANWRDRRLRDVSPGTVRREMGLLGAVLRVARQEWGALVVNPMENVRKPPAPPPRDRLPTNDEIERLRHVAGDDLGNATARAFHAFLFACETAMRAGEIVGLTWDRVDLAGRVVDLPMTKNGHARQVPLSSRAVALLEALPVQEPVFGLTSQKLDALWRKIRGKAAVEGLTFHDSRAAALTMLSRKVDVMTLARISGHRDLSILLNTYYRETARDIAARLD